MSTIPPSDLPDPNEPTDADMEMAAREHELGEAAHAGQLAARFHHALTGIGIDSEEATHLTGIWMRIGASVE